MTRLNLFYEEPDPDRWFKFDRYPRKVLRTIIRGTPRPGGPQIVALNLMKGLEKMGVPYRLNDYKYIREHTDEIACIIGKPHLLFKREWKNPVIFGAAVYSHPIEHPDLFSKYPNIKRILVPGNWICEMFKPYYGNKVVAWPTGIDTESWTPVGQSPRYDFLIYNKIDHLAYRDSLLKPILSILEKKGLSYQLITYGTYNQEELKTKLALCRSAIFLSRSETQGFAYQQILATDTPVLAWDKNEYWEDPSYYPHKVKYQPVSAVPYWDDRCGLKFRGMNDFGDQLERFLNTLGNFKPRDFIMENLTLERCAEKYIKIYNEVLEELI